MTQSYRLVIRPAARLLRPLTLALVCLAGPVLADDYGDVSQLMRAGKMAEAQAKVDAFLATKPGDAQMRFFKGVLLRNAGKTPEAIAVFSKLSEDYPELPEPYNNIAVLYAGQGQYDKARTALEMAIRTNPSYATAHENLGDVYARMASQAYNKALQLEGVNPAVQPKLALIREIFNPAAKGQRPADASSTAVAAAPTPKPSKPAPAAAVVAGANPAQGIKPPLAAAGTGSTATPAASTATAAPPTTTVATAKPTPAKPAPVGGGTVPDAEAAVRAWAKAWAARDVGAYLAYYGAEFQPAGKQGRSAWEADRRQRILGKSSISVQLDNLTVSVQGDKAVARFRQHYKADNLSVSSRKTLELARVDGQWRIVRESTGN